MSVTVVEGQGCGEAGHRDAMLDSNANRSAPRLLKQGDENLSSDQIAVKLLYVPAESKCAQYCAKKKKEMHLSFTDVARVCLFIKQVHYEKLEPSEIALKKLKLFYIIEQHKIKKKIRLI